MPRNFPFLPTCFCGLALLMFIAAGCDSKPETPPADTPAPAPPEDPGVDAANAAEAAPEAGDDTSEAMSDAAAPDGNASPLPSPSTADDAEAEPAGTAQAEPAELPPGTDPLVPAGVTRPTTEGWWRIVFSVNGNEHSAGFLEITKDDAGKFAVGEIRTNSVINPAKIVRSNATDKTLELFFDDNAGNQFDYAGNLAGNVIRGNLQFDSPRQNLVRLVPAEEANVTDEEVEKQQLGTTFGLEEISAAIQGDDPAAGLSDVAKTWPNSPVLYMAYDMLISQAKPLEFDRKTVESLIAGFEKTGAVWGERARQAAKINAAASLLYTVHEVDLATAKLNEARKEAPELVAKWEELLKPAERIVAIEQARQQIDDGNTEQGLAALRTLYTERPTDPVGTYRLAAAEQKHGSKDNAMKLFAQLAVQPQADAELSPIADEVDFTLPRTAAARLFEEKNGNRDGLPEFLNEAYHESVTSFLTDEQKNRQPTDSDRTTLVELFTGAMCPPCVAADVATEAVERSFPASDAVVLRYHLHIPGPDPLSNSDSEDRRDFYGDEVRGTPTVFIDGSLAPHNVGGRYSSAPDVYEALAESVTAAAEKPAGATIELNATVEDNVLKIAATAAGIENPPETLRLRIVLAENQIDFAASNGIRGHEMVVREMPGGAAGVAAVDGKFSYQQDVPLVETRDRLATYLRDFEKQLGGQGGQNFSFPQKPLDLRRLTVVAFLQDDATHEILQSAVLPIEQEIELPALADASATAPESEDSAPEAADTDTADDEGTPAPEAADEAAGPSITPPE